MTDKEKLEQLLKEFGLGYNLSPYNKHDDHSILLEADYGNVSGYSCFTADFEFDKNGKFKSCGIWE